MSCFSGKARASQKRKPIYNRCGFEKRSNTADKDSPLIRGIDYISLEETGPVYPWQQKTDLFNDIIIKSRLALNKGSEVYIKMNEACLIVGLGNPGGQYSETRHNIGFSVLDDCAEKEGAPWTTEKKLKGQLAHWRCQHKKVFGLKPSTYMNLSGESVQAVCQYYKVPASNILVVYDDVDLAYGRVRFRQEGSAGTHNGMKSIIQCLGTQAFPRFRIGVGAPLPGWDLADYVLAPFSKIEQASFPEVLTGCHHAITHWISNGTASAMNRYNGQLFSNNS
jgi:peptidyl-tRNA hydrolase, PTH1 family